MAYAIDVASTDTEDFIRRFGFPLTGAQENAIKHIFGDLERDVPMSRLLEGDVGSGKTAVAAAAAYATIMNRPSLKLRGAKSPEQLQPNRHLVVYRLPTWHRQKILATQHFESFIELFRHTGISIALITGSGCRKFPSKGCTSPRT